MKKILIMILALMVALSGCANKPADDTQVPDGDVTPPPVSDVTPPAVDTEDDDDENIEVDGEEENDEPVVTSPADKQENAAKPSKPAVKPAVKPESAEPLDLEEVLYKVTENPRPAGSKGEKEAVKYLSKQFENLGYDVKLQKYAVDGVTMGHNVIATRGESKNGDILVISAHHDSAASSFGANDNGSGVAALLLAAEKLADAKTDTELRFISFTDEENGKNGSRYYVDSLSAKEKDRIVGCIQFDMLGGLGSEGIKLGTTDGKENWLTELLMEAEDTLAVSAEDGSDHAIFQLAGIPSVVVTQSGRGYLYHTAGDRAESLNPDLIRQAAEFVSETVKHIASDETESYKEIADKQAGEYFFSHTRQSRIMFSAEREVNEAYLGFSGKLVDQWEDKGEFWEDVYQVYEYEMGWFGGEKRMTTHYIYRNNYLENVEIHPSKNGYTIEQLVGLITATHGEPIEADAAEGSWNWEDELYGKYISLKETDDKPVVYVYSYSLGISNILATYDVTGGEALVSNPQHKKVWELLCKAIPAEHRQKIGQFQLFTDGYSNILAVTSTMGEAENPDNTRFSIMVDYYDVYDEHGNARDWSKLLYTLIHEYGHVLLENDTQIDVSVNNNIHDPEGFIEGSFRKEYYDKFWQDPYSSYLGSYWEKPENYVSEYAGNMFHEDIADTFAVFVFSSKPEGNSVAEQKILFFWEDDDMVALREDIRDGLGLENAK